MDWHVESSDNARKLRGVNFIDSEDDEFQETIKIVRKKFEALLKTTCVRWGQEGVSKELREIAASGDIHPHKKTKCACICGKFTSKFQEGR